MHVNSCQALNVFELQIVLLCKHQEPAPSSFFLASRHHLCLLAPTLLKGAAQRGRPARPYSLPLAKKVGASRVA